MSDGFPIVDDGFLVVQGDVGTVGGASAGTQSACQNATEEVKKTGEKSFGGCA